MPGRADAGGCAVTATRDETVEAISGLLRRIKQIRQQIRADSEAVFTPPFEDAAHFRTKFIPATAAGYGVEPATGTVILARFNPDASDLQRIGWGRQQALDVGRDAARGGDEPAFGRHQDLVRRGRQALAAGAAVLTRFDDRKWRRHGEKDEG